MVAGGECSQLGHSVTTRILSDDRPAGRVGCQFPVGGIGEQRGQKGDR